MLHCVDHHAIQKMPTILPVVTICINSLMVVIKTLSLSSMSGVINAGSLHQVLGQAVSKTRIPGSAPICQGLLFFVIALRSPDTAAKGRRHILERDILLEGVRAESAGRPGVKITFLVIIRQIAHRSSSTVALAFDLMCAIIAVGSSCRSLL